MLLDNKVAVIYGGAGSVGSVAPRTFAGEGAQVFLAGRTLAPLDKIADEIRESGGMAEAGEVDACDPDQVEAHLEELVGATGRVDVSMNATSLRGDLQGTPLREMKVDDFTLPPATGLRSNFCTATAAGLHRRRHDDAGR